MSSTKSAKINISQASANIQASEAAENYILPERAKSETEPLRRSAPSEEGGPTKLVEMQVLLVQTPSRKSTRNKDAPRLNVNTVVFLVVPSAPKTSQN